MRVIVLFVLVGVAYSAATTCTEPTTCGAVPWAFAGPAGWADPGDPTHMVSASATNVAAHVPSAGAWLSGTVNGGVWRTTSSTLAKVPHWVPVLEGQNVTCSSIVAIHVSGVTPTPAAAAAPAASRVRTGTS